MAERKGKRKFISLSSSSEEEKDDDDDEEEEGDDVQCSENDDDDEDEDDDEDDDDDDDDDESLCNKVIRRLKEGNDLGSLNLEECKAYLRKHGLRLAGTKVVCIQRIKEHWRIKDGSGEALYPRSSFVINCTGDVCNGDVVLFTQKVYEKFDKVKRHGRPLGKRTIAGKVVKESYGAGKQQHTFTVEVLWSKGINSLPPLFPLLVKGRNLYKLRTFRQCWNNESERIKVLAEKHRRGTAARLVRAMKKTKKTWSTNGGVKRQKDVHHTRPSQSRKITAPEKRKHFDRHGKETFQRHANIKNYHQCHNAPPLRQVSLKGNVMPGTTKSSRAHQNFSHPNNDRVPTIQSYINHPENAYQSQMKFQNISAPYQFSGYYMGSTSTMMRSSPYQHYAGTSVVPAAQHLGFQNSIYTHNAYSNPTYNFELNNFNHTTPESMNVGRLLRPFCMGTETYGQRKYRF